MYSMIYAKNLWSIIFNLTDSMFEIKNFASCTCSRKFGQNLFVGKICHSTAKIVVPKNCTKSISLQKMPFNCKKWQFNVWNQKFCIFYTFQKIWTKSLCWHNMSYNCKKCHSKKSYKFLSKKCRSTARNVQTKMHNIHITLTFGLEIQKCFSNQLCQLKKMLLLLD